MPCLRRAASVEEEYEAAGGEVLLDNEDNDGWLATHGKPKGKFLTEVLYIVVLHYLFDLILLYFSASF